MSERPSSGALDHPRLPDLLRRLDELLRWRPGQEGKYLDVHDALSRIEGSANHVILGRRGSGKTRLLSELRSRNETMGKHVVYIGAEDYKKLTYPDILIQILRTFLRAFSEQLSQQSALLSSRWWHRQLNQIRHPLHSLDQRRRRRGLLLRLTILRANLDALFSEDEEISATYRQGQQMTRSTNLGLSGGEGAVLKASRFSESEIGSNRTIEQREEKRTKVERLLADFKHLLNDISAFSGQEVVLAVDDFYFIRRLDQPSVIDYMHRICKDTRAFLKVTTVKHRSWLYDQGDITQGVLAGHEIQNIDLDIPLGRYDAVRQFLDRIWSEVCRTVGVGDPKSFFKGEGFDQVVLASGGVPRDFFGIIAAAIEIARDRQDDGIGKLRVNEAARRYTEQTKFPELKRDTSEQEQLLEFLLMDIVTFARDDRKRNCFHINLDDLDRHQDLHRMINALVDSRLLHLISDNTSNAHRGGRFAAYLLDVGLYAHPLRRGDRAVDEVVFWERDSAGRLVNLQRSPVYRLRTVEEIQSAAVKAEADGAELTGQVLFPKAEQYNNDNSATEQLKLYFPPATEVQYP